ERRPAPGECGDLAALAELDEAVLLGWLRERFLRQQVYTDIGDILVAMNPFQPLPLYRREVSLRGSRRPVPAAPHRPVTASPPSLPRQVSERYEHRGTDALPP
ncbi:MYO16 protein, partial [Halcyon senegalensis]|nr:MYO16 protein [Halcyon senegalensis]